MKDPEEKKKSLNDFAKYTAISVQMLVTIGIFAFIGYKIDASRGPGQPLFTALFSLLGVVLSLYQVVRQLNKTK